jgi:hypothetical protein
LLLADQPAASQDDPATWSCNLMSVGTTAEAESRIKPKNALLENAPFADNSERQRNILLISFNCFTWKWKGKVLSLRLQIHLIDLGDV